MHLNGLAVRLLVEGLSAEKAAQPDLYTGSTRTRGEILYHIEFSGRS